MRERISPEPELDGDLLEQFEERGYLVLPGFLPSASLDRLEREVDLWVDSGLRQKSIDACREPQAYGTPDVLEIQLEAHGELAVHAPLMALLSEVMGPSFVFHHMHCDRRAPGAPGKGWHHDYEQVPQRGRDRIMVHALHYIRGLRPELGGLAVLPGSHREIAEKTARAHLGTRELPSETVIDELPAGSTVVIHSALFHARRSAPGATGGPRYMIDASYCQTGTRWPPVKPYWRHVLATARDLGLDRGWPDLFDERHFTEYGTTGAGATDAAAAEDGEATRGARER
ncbi:phytanoyl-CoA dioxygenase family protein [Streptomyces sp. NPDC059096]|uniref:phytanoyl-CoA dioxygenase family protein n=1 Tax=Streptomyces sp. NPDC059096 TaxID=3346727 RepID=UPI0036C37133